MTAGPTIAARLAIVGAGPRSAMLLERVVARRTPDDEPIEIVLIDPHPPGPGRIWRREQSPLLRLNSMARDVTVFTDDTCAIEGPIRPGPSLIEWLEQWRTGEHPDVDPGDASAEARALTADGFPTRRLHSHYLAWFLQRTIASAPHGTSVRWVQDTVVGVDPSAGARIRLASGDELDADAVVYALGHNARHPDGATVALLARAESERVTYVPPSFTADADLRSVEAGRDVIVRGMGLAAVDLVVLLAEGRGGRFVRSSEGLRYERSGDEPRLHLGSRRGVPYRSKVSSTLQGDPPSLEALTDEVRDALVARPGLLDFETDVWPLLATELLIGHYRELFTGHPERVRGRWTEFRDIILRYRWDATELHDAAVAQVPDPADRFDVDELDRPLAGLPASDADTVHARVRAHIVRDLGLRTRQEHSPAQGVFLAALLSFMSIAEIPAERWNVRSRIEGLARLHTFFSYVASGPPPQRLEELLALADAGVVRFLGPDVTVDIAGGAVIARTRSGEVRADALVDAWLPEADAAASENPALRELADVHGTVLRLADGDRRVSVGRVLVDTDGRVVRPDGTAHDTLFAIGPFTSRPEAGAFTRPRSNALSFRSTDRVAATVLDALARVHAG